MCNTGNKTWLWDFFFSYVCVIGTCLMTYFEIWLTWTSTLVLWKQLFITWNKIILSKDIKRASRHYYHNDMIYTHTPYTSDTLSHSHPHKYNIFTFPPSLNQRLAKAFALSYQSRDWSGADQFLDLKLLSNRGFVVTSREMLQGV